MLLLVPTAREARALFDDGRAPRSEDPESLEVGGRPVRAALCGFGPAAAGALAALALARERPRHCLLLGLAGTYDGKRLPVGALMTASELSFPDLGVMRGGVWMGPRAMGLEQAPPAAGRAAVVEELVAAPPPYLEGLVKGRLVSVARASGSPAEALARCEASPGALGEDMEGFSVALAATRLDIACSIVRAASNVAGESDRSRWELQGALGALRAWLLAARL